MNKQPVRLQGPYLALARLYLDVWPEGTVQPYDVVARAHDEIFNLRAQVKALEAERRHLRKRLCDKCAPLLRGR